MNLPGGESTPPSSTTGSRRLRVKVRYARYRDIGTLSRLYVALGPESRHGYHPFPFHRVAVSLIYFSLITAQRLLGWAMRRSTRLLAFLFVAEATETGAIVGSGTLRGVLAPNEPPRVRFGFFVAEGYQGFGVGKSILFGLAEIALGLGYKQGQGAVFKSDTKAIRAISEVGFRFMDTDFRDPKVPGETNYRTIADLDEMVRRSRERDRLHGLRADAVPS